MVDTLWIDRSCTLVALHSHCYYTKRHTLRWCASRMACNVARWNIPAQKEALHLDTSKCISQRYATPCKRGVSHWGNDCIRFS
jgi:hypothetical protein